MFAYPTRTLFFYGYLNLFKHNRPYWFNQNEFEFCGSDAKFSILELIVPLSFENKFKLLGPKKLNGNLIIFLTASIRINSHSIYVIYFEAKHLALSFKLYINLLCVDELYSGNCRLKN